MEKHIINLTKTPLNLMTKEGAFIVVPSSGEIRLEIIRIEEKIKALSPSGKEIKVNNTIIKSFKNLPDRRDDTIIVVPTIVYTALAHIRDDVYTIDEPYKEGGVTKYAKAISRQKIKSTQDDFEIISQIITNLSSLNTKMIEAESIVDTHSLSEEISNKLFSIRKITDKY